MPTSTLLQTVDTAISFACSGREEELVFLFMWFILCTRLGEQNPLSTILLWRSPENVFTVKTYSVEGAISFCTPLHLIFAYFKRKGHFLMYSGCSQATMVHDLTGLDGIFLSNPDCLF